MLRCCALFKPEGFIFIVKGYKQYAIAKSIRAYIYHDKIKSNFWLQHYLQN